MNCFKAINRRLLLLCLLIISFGGTILTAQEADDLVVTMGAHTDHHQDGPCVSPEEYSLIRSRAAANKEAIKAKGKWEFPEESRSPGLALSWPLTYTADFYDFDYYVITNFVDNDPDSNSLQDWNCGSRSYDLGSYDHDGMDISIGPSGWNMMAAQQVNIIAALSGIIIDKSDGNFDQNCAFGSGTPANFVLLEHFDGSTTFYTHMKNGSVTDKEIGDWVGVGEYLGKVGSSGNSTGPHLHFEVRDDLGNLIDPYSGPCNDLNDDSWWAIQKPYVEPAILKMITLSGAVTGGADCNDPDNIPEKNHFSDYDNIRFQYYVRDIQQGDTVSMVVYRPNGSQKWTNINAYNGNYLTLASFFTSATFGNETAGTWKWELTYKGKVYAHYFTIDCSSYALAGAHTGRRGYLAGDYITSTSTISASAANNILYEAENYIRLDPGFVATAGCTLLAKIDPCDAGGTLAPVVTEEEDVVSEADPKPAVLVYPNPFREELTVAIPTELEGQAVQIQLTDVAGRIFIDISSSNDREVRLSTGNLPDGVYFVFLNAAGYRAVEKVVRSKT